MYEFFKKKEVDIEGWIIAITFMIIPLYVFPSGGFHIVDIPILILSTFIFFSLSQREASLGLKLINPFIPFLIWVLFVTVYYMMSSSSSRSYLVGAIQVLYNFYIFFLFLVAFWRILARSGRHYYIAVGILISCLVPWFFPPRYGIERVALSFNNANQLGYYAVLILMVLTIFSRFYANNPRRGKQYIFFSLIVAFSANALACVSGSRAALISIGLLDIYFLFHSLRLYRNFLFILLPYSILSLLLVYLILYSTVRPDYSLTNLVPRLAEKDLVDTGDIYHRSFGQFNMDDELGLVFGQGSSAKIEDSEKVERVYNKEVHNSLLGIFQSYGIIGGTLFILGSAIFMNRLQYQNKWFLLIPIIAYNMSHYGLRFRLMWITLAFLAAASILLDINGKYRNPKLTHIPLS